MASQQNRLQTLLSTQGQHHPAAGPSLGAFLSSGPRSDPSQNTLNIPHSCPLNCNLCCHQLMPTPAVALSHCGPFAAGHSSPQRAPVSGSAKALAEAHKGLLEWLTLSLSSPSFPLGFLCFRVHDLFAETVHSLSFLQELCTCWPLCPDALPPVIMRLSSSLAQMLSLTFLK